MNGLEDTLVTELITSSSGCADLSAPVLFCGEDLALVEMNGAARSRSTLRRGDDLREHLPPDDAHEVRALIHRQNAGHTVARIIKSREFSWALVIPKRFFGMNFGQFFLYKNKREMLSSQSFRSIVSPPRFSGGRGALYVNNETERVYGAVASSTPSVLDVKSAALAVVREARTLGIKNLRCATSLPVGEVLIQVSEVTLAVRTLAVAYSVVSELSSEGEAMLKVERGESDAAVTFTCRAVTPAGRLFGDFSPELIGEAYPCVAARSHILHYLCSLSGVFCSFAVSGGKITLRLVFREDGTEPIRVKHEDAVITGVPAEVGLFIKYLARFDEC